MLPGRGLDSFVAGRAGTSSQANGLANGLKQKSFQGELTLAQVNSLQSLQHVVSGLPPQYEYERTLSMDSPASRAP